MFSSNLHFKQFYRAFIVRLATHVLLRYIFLLKQFYVSHSQAIRGNGGRQKQPKKMCREERAKAADFDVDAVASKASARRVRHPKPGDVSSGRS